MEVKDALNNLQNALNDLVVKCENYSKLIKDDEPEPEHRTKQAGNHERTKAQIMTAEIIEDVDNVNIENAANNSVEQTDHKKSQSTGSVDILQAA